MWKIFEYEYIYTHIYVSCGSNLCVTKPAVIFRMSSFRNIALTNVNFSLGVPSASFFSPDIKEVIIPDRLISQVKNSYPGKYIKTCNNDERFQKHILFLLLNGKY